MENNNNKNINENIDENVKEVIDENANENLDELDNTQVNDDEVSFDDIIADSEKKSKKEKKKNKKPKKEKKHKLKKFLNSRKAKRGGIAAAIVIIFFCIIVLINMITGMLVNRFPDLQFDMTASQTYQLQEDTVEYLDQIDTDINIYAFATEKSFKNGLSAYSGSEYVVQGYKLLKKMAAASDKISLEFMELSSNPTFTNNYDNINWEGTDSTNLILIDAGDDNYTVLTLEDCFEYDEETLSYYGYYAFTGTTIEQAVVTGILDVTTTDKVGIDFITSSGEDSDEFSALKSLLKQNAYDVNEVSLTTGDFSDDAEIAFIYAPTVDLSDDAVEKVQEWLDNDGEYGRTLVYIPTDSDVDTPNLDSLLAEYGMEVGDGISYCLSSSYYVNSPYIFLTDYVSDIYTADLKNSTIPTIVGYSRDIDITDEDTAVALLDVETSVGVIPFDADTSEIESTDDLEKYSKESINLAAVGTKTNEDEESSNVAVFASRYMFSSEYLSTSSYNNGNYIVNFCNTVTDRGDLGITITSAEMNSSELGITNASTIIVMGVIFVGVIPVAVLIIGLVMFIRRRLR